MVVALFGIGFLSFSVWAHHMFATGAVLLPFFSFLTYLIAVPTGIILQLDRHDVARPVDVRDADALGHRLPGHVPARRSDRRPVGRAPAGLPPQRQLLRRHPFPLRALRHHRLRGLRRHLLLVPQDVRPDDGRAAPQAALLDDLYRGPPDASHTAPA